MEKHLPVCSVLNRHNAIRSDLFIVWQLLLIAFKGFEFGFSFHFVVGYRFSRLRIPSSLLADVSFFVARMSNEESMVPGTQGT
jgi:hypothetical protein